MSFGRKKMWTYFRLVTRYAGEISLEELQLVADKLGYQRGWAWYKYQELLNSPPPPPEPRQPPEPKPMVPSWLREPMKFFTDHGATLMYPYTSKDVQRSFRIVARKTHPDTGGTAALFHAAMLARDVLDRYVMTATTNTAEDPDGPPF